MNTPNLDAIEDKLVRKCELFSQFVEFLDINYLGKTFTLDKLSDIERKDFLIKFRTDFGSNDDSYPTLTLLLDVGAYRRYSPMRFNHFVESSTVRLARKEIESALIQLLTSYQTQLFARRLQRHDELIYQLLSYIEMIRQLLSPDSQNMEDDRILNKLDPDNDESLREALRTVDWLVSFARETQFETQYWKEILDEYLQIIEPNKIIKSSTIEWVGDKTDLAELVWAVYKSGRIRDKATGKTITQIKLVDAFGKLFDTDLDVVQLMKGRWDSHKARDGKTFLPSLCQLVTDEIERKNQ